MTAILKRVEDPRDQLERARRYELVSYARANGMAEISADMPAVLIRRKLRAKGLVRPQIPTRILGMPERTVPADVTPSGSSDVDAADDLERQFARESAAKTGINGLRAECKRLGIKLSRKDNMDTMKAKIQAHGD